MKYRQKLSDFVVEEIANHKVLKTGKYKLYILEKEGRETFGLLDLISNTNQIPLNEIGIAGLKDTYAHTKQYITIPSKFKLKDMQNVKFKFLGFLNSPIRLGDLSGNKFIITVREIGSYEIEHLLKNVKSVIYGIPNYFDSQRFGSVIEKEFIARFLIRKDYESALKQHLTSIVKSDDEIRITDKENILSSWGKFDVDIKSPDLKRLVNIYKKSNNWKITYKHISKPLRQIFISSYQSYIWNECVKLIIQSKLKNEDISKVDYAVDQLYFNKIRVPELPRTFQTISHKMIPNEFEKEILKQVLEKEGLTIEQFNIRQSGNFFKSRLREIMFYPKGFEISHPVKNGLTYDVTLKFILPKSSYATVVLKKIFEQ